MLNATLAGNIRAWSDDAGTTGPNAGTGVYNPSVASPQPGEVLYNTGYSTIAVGSDGGFYLSVANGQIDMTINVTGYWVPGLVMPSGHLNQTLRHDGSNWVASDAFRSYSDGTLHASGVLSSGTFLNYGTGPQMNWLAGYAAFRAGFVNGTAWDNNHIGKYSFATGVDTIASNDMTTALGNLTTASGVGATAIGYNSTASGIRSVAIGVGSATSASGDSSIAIGENATTNFKVNSFVFGDGTAPTGNSASFQFMVRASNGTRFYTSTNTTAGVELTPGSGSWTTLSDKRAKDMVQPVDSRAVLEKIAKMPLATWHYKTQDAKYRHMGPMAQDFYAAFKLGESDTGIDTVDADGVALAAIQGLDTLLKEEEARTATRLDEKDREIAALRAEIAAQKSRVASLESIAGELADVKAQISALRLATPVTVALQP